MYLDPHLTTHHSNRCPIENINQIALAYLITKLTYCTKINMFLECNTFKTKFIMLIYYFQRYVLSKEYSIKAYIFNHHNILLNGMIFIFDSHALTYIYIYVVNETYTWRCYKALVTQSCNTYFTSIYLINIIYNVVFFCFAFCFLWLKLTVCADKVVQFFLMTPFNSKMISHLLPTTSQ